MKTTKVRRVSIDFAIKLDGNAEEVVEWLQRTNPTLVVGYQLDDFGPVFISSERVTWHVQQGEWILLNPMGTVMVVTAEQFEANYRIEK